MIFALVIIGSFLLYNTSKYFPAELFPIIGKFNASKFLLKISGSLCLMLSLILSGLQFGWGTGFVIFLTALMLGLCLTLMTLPLNRLLVYVMTIVCVVLIVAENLI